MKEKKVILTSSNITQKQWSNLLIELNLVCESWRPYAKINLQAQELYKKSLYGEEAEFDFSNRFINMLN